MMLSTVYVLIITAYTNLGGVSVAMHDFPDQQTCQNAEYLYQEQKIKYGNFSITTVCAPATR